MSMMFGYGIGPGSAVEACLNVQDRLKQTRFEPSSTREEPAEGRRQGMSALLIAGVFVAGLLAGMLLG